MKKTLYLECFSGISGDMTVGALIDLGVNQEELIKKLNTIPLDGYEIEIKKVEKNSILATDFNVILETNNHDHDMDYLHHKHSDEHHHEHHHDHSHQQHHEHRNLQQVNEIIDNTDISDNAKNISKKIFSIIAEAEAIAHGKELENIHFHEVGAVDSIVDIVAIAICIDEINVEKVIVSNLTEGRGFINCQHGLIPIPVPAVCNIAIKYNLHFHNIDLEGELVTPTGAAIVAALRTDEKLPEKYKIVKIGIGAGKRNYKTPGILRAMIIEEVN